MTSTSFPELKTYRAVAAAPGYPYGVHVTVEAESIEAAHEEVEAKGYEVITIGGPGE